MSFFSQRMLRGAVASGIAAILTTPLDVIAARLMTDPAKKSEELQVSPVAGADSTVSLVPQQASVWGKVCGPTVPM